MKTLLDIDPRLKQRKADELIDLPAVIYVTEFTDESAEAFAKDMRAAHLTGQPVIPVVINSNGGECHNLLAMVAEIDASAIPVATICVGKAMSAGSILLACGTKGHRYCDPNASVMIHDLFTFSGGKGQDVISDARETAKLRERLLTLLSLRCGRNKAHFAQELKAKSNVDLYLTAKEAKREGLVDHLRIPSFRVRIGVEVTIE